MDVGSISSSYIGQQQYPMARPTQEPVRESDGSSARKSQSAPDKVQANEQPDRSAQTQQAQQMQREQRPEQPKPVVNSQGQKTGTIINTTA